MKVKDVIKKVEQDGWLYSRTRGDHHVYHHPTKPGIVVIAGKLSDEMPVGTYQNVMRQAGLPK